MTKLERLFVWLGGAAFVGSLTFCAYAFGVQWVDPTRTRPSWEAVGVDTALFTAFAFHHSLFAREPVKAWLSKAVPDRLLRTVYVWTASLLLIAVVVAWQPVGGELYRAIGWARYAHAFVQLAGLWFIARSVGVIDALALAGIRTRDRPTRLQIAGPYRFVRHPLYLGWIAVVFGAAPMTGDRAMFAAITTLYLFIAMPWEERSLERTFGSDYTRYRERVPWRIIPYIY